MKMTGGIVFFKGGGGVYIYIYTFVPVGHRSQPQTSHTRDGMPGTCTKLMCHGVV